MNASPHSDPARPARATLCPIPRDGVNGSSGVILAVLLTLAAATVGIGFCSFGAGPESAPSLSQGIAVASLLLFVLYLWRVTRTSIGRSRREMYIAVASPSVSGFVAIMTSRTSEFPTRVKSSLIFS